MDDRHIYVGCGFRTSDVTRNGVVYSRTRHDKPGSEYRNLYFGRHK